MEHIEESRIADNKKITEKDLHFYYNREERLAKASARVRALYEDAPKKKFSPFSSLTDSKPKAFMFVSIIVMCILVLLKTYLLPDNKTVIANNSLITTTMRYENQCFIVIKKSALKKNVYTGIVDVRITDARNINNGTPNFYNKSIVFSEAKEEEFRWAIPLISDELIFFIQAGADTTSFRIKTE
jgi:hypothetical protein